MQACMYMYVRIRSVILDQSAKIQTVRATIETIILSRKRRAEIPNTVGSEGQR